MPIAYQPLDLPKAGNKKLRMVARSNDDGLDYIVMRDDSDPKKRVWHLLSDYKVVKSCLGRLGYEKK